MAPILLNQMAYFYLGCYIVKGMADPHCDSGSVYPQIYNLSSPLGKKKVHFQKTQWFTCDIFLLAINFNFLYQCTPV